MPPTMDRDNIHLERMRQLKDAASPDDDWTGVTDPAVRRKRQNRLNARAYRRREADKVKTMLDHEGHWTVDETKQHCKEPRDPALQPQMTETALGDRLPPYEKITGNARSSSSICASGDVNTFYTSSIWVDCLLEVVHLNVWRALITNSKLISMVVSESRTIRLSPIPVPGSMPPSLAPTILQQTIPHQTWIDCCPLAALRDNLILAEGTYDENEWCGDMLGSLFHHSSGKDICGLVAWTQPWHVSGWEVADGFVKKWGWLLTGCEELIFHTNKWRALRDEEPLRLDLIACERRLHDRAKA